MTVATASPSIAELRLRYPDVFRKARGHRFLPLFALIAVILYCVYVVWFFSIPSILMNAHWERAGDYLSQWIAYEVRPEFRIRDGAVETRWSRFSPLGDHPHPGWITTSDKGAITVAVDGLANAVTIAPGAVTVTHGGESTTLDMTGATPVARAPLPAWAVVKEDEIRVSWGFWGSTSIATDRIKVARRFLGWANFIFDTHSPFFDKPAGEVIGLLLSGRRIDPDRSNLALALDNFWNNSEWQHGDVWSKLFQTIVMAFAGTLMAGLVAFPLAFLAARNITPSRLVNQAAKRFFDFQRSVDMLIWALFFTRAFGPGPLSGIAAIFFTDTGTMGKLYSEALENIDDRPREGVKSVGAAPVLIQRFAVLPQVVPVFASQILYQWESNTRSATIIGAVGAGGIGLKLWEAMQTNTNWANVFYMVILILIVVFVFDAISNRLRRQLVGDMPT